MAMERWRPFGLSTSDRWEPFRVSDIQTEVNRVFDNFFGRSAAAAGRNLTPPVDMYATKDDLVLTLELPGMSEKDVSVSITGDLLTVKGERRFENQDKDRIFSTSSGPTGSSSGSFSCRWRCSPMA